ncbi:hypothetical protein K466DRAFT_458109, partial [Polyporus arcularius HHB13444]
MPNPNGVNGYHNGEVPSDDVLREELLQYAKERLPLKRRLERLEAEPLKYYISFTKLKELNKKFNIPTSRKPPPLPLATALVCDKISGDIQKRNGPDEILKMIASEGQYILPR